MKILSVHISGHSDTCLPSLAGVCQEREHVEAEAAGSRVVGGRVAHRRARVGAVVRVVRDGERAGGLAVARAGVDLRPAVGRLLGRRGRRSDIVDPRTRWVARRQRNPPDDWVRFKTPAWRTSYIMRSFSWRTADKENRSLTIIVTRVR